MNADLRPDHPASFSDPLALRIEWTPLGKGSSNYRTHQLVEGGAGRLEFVPTRVDLAFGAFSIAIGVTLGLGYFISPPSKDVLFDLILPLAFTLVFLVTGAAMLWSSLAPRAFDRGAGTFRIGRTPSCRIAEIHALQIVSKQVRRKGGSHASYEVNVVTRDGRRIHVVGHGDADALRADAQKLAQALGCKLWDSTR